jgi:Glycosyltransferase like family 2
MRIDPGTLPPLDPSCRITVAIPAKNEAESIGATLLAFSQQRALDGSSIDPRTFEVLVLCNDCSDGTADVVRWFGAQSRAPRIHLLEASLAPSAAHVGTARRALLDVASDRYLGAGRPRGILASTDADSRVDHRWIAWTLAEMEAADAVAGHVEVSDEERERMLAPMRLLYDRERTYRRLIGELEAAKDPADFDPAPRHDAFVGTSFAVAAATYRNAGGLAPLPRLEDQAFARRLQRIDARVRHSYAVRVATSARRVARVDGGFATFIDDLAARGERGESFPVLAARRSIAESCARAALRRMRKRIDDSGDVARAMSFFRLEEPALRAIVSDAATFGEGFARALDLGTPRSYPDEPVESAIAKLRASLAARKPVAPTLARTASGAG